MQNWNRRASEFWGAHAPPRAALGALAKRTLDRNRPRGNCFRRGAENSTRGRVRSPGYANLRV
ncbi:MAG: hypothetical protein DME60_12930 [Verrucomicrobia bacterium]|nr:MAG: hypothetical protein DME60_12930 [Verrucomicrobiota bacterium]